MKTNIKTITKSISRFFMLVVRIKHKLLIVMMLFSIWYVISSSVNLYMTKYENIAYFDTVREEISMQYEIPVRDLKKVVKRNWKRSEGQYIVRVKGEDPLCLDDNEAIILKIEEGISLHSERRERASARFERSIILLFITGGIVYFRIWLFGLIRDIKGRLKKKR